MAATVISVVQAGPVGIAGAPATVTPDAVNGNSYPNPGNAPCVLSIINNSASPVTCTINLPNTPYNGYGSIGTTQAIAVPASATRMVCLEPSVYNNAAGQVTFLMSSATSVTCSVTQFNRAFP